MAKPCTLHPIPQAEQFFKIETANVGGRGGLPLAFSWGFKGAILSRERMAPFARFPASGGENRSPFGTQKRRDHCSVAPNFYSLRKRSAMTAAASAVDSAPVSR